MNVGEGLSAPSLSSDGSRMLVTASRQERDVWKVPLGRDPDANGRAAVRLLDTTRDPMWTFVSRDGRILLYNSPASGSRNLWITAIPGDAVAHSSLSPDGSRVAFASNATGHSNIWVQDLDGSGLRQLTNDPTADSWPVWSPDGRWIVYSSLRGSQETWRVRSDGSSPAEKLVDGFFRGDWSRIDGRSLIVTSDGGANVRLIDVDHRSVVWEKRASAGGTLSLPQFSPDGRRISVPLPEARGRDAVWILDTATGEGRVGARFTSRLQILFRASWVDDGAAVVVNGSRTQTHIQLLDRFWAPRGTRR
jgi:Tol biopolymer transport system component